MKTKLQNILEELHCSLKALYGERLTHIVLYGSQARGDAEEESDIDVLVVLRGSVSPCKEIKRTLNDVAEISLNHNVVISCVFISDKQYESEQSPLLLNIKREGIMI